MLILMVFWFQTFLRDSSERDGGKSEGDNKRFKEFGNNHFKVTCNYHVIVDDKVVHNNQFDIHAFDRENL